MYKPTLLLDVDGVLRNIVDPVIEIYKRDFDSSSISKHDDAKLYDLSDVCPLVNNMTNMFFKNNKYSKEIFLNGKLYEPDVVDTLTKLNKAMNIHIVTHQYRGNENYTLEWLLKNNIPYDMITFSHDKTVVEGDYFIDDNVHHLKSVMLDSKKSVVPIAYSQNWNSEWEGNRIKSLKNFLFEYFI